MRGYASPQCARARSLPWPPASSAPRRLMRSTPPGCCPASTSRPTYGRPWDPSQPRPGWRSPVVWHCLPCGPSLRSPVVSRRSQSPRSPSSSAGTTPGRSASPARSPAPWSSGCCCWLSSPWPSSSSAPCRLGPRRRPFACASGSRVRSDLTATSLVMSTAVAGRALRRLS